MDFVPVMIITLCRYEHFVRCIESLKRNALARETELYIGLDYPLKDEHWDGYNLICDYLKKGIGGFKDVHIIKHEKNLGSVENYCAVRDEIYKRHEGYIYTEDDNEFSPNYLEYMNVCMNQYRRNPKVLAVSGYMYPVDTTGTQGNVVAISSYFSCFGYGVYRETDELFKREINMENFEKMYYDKKKMKKLYEASANQYGNFVKGMLEYTGDEMISEGKIKEIDLTYGLFMFFNDYQMIFPIISKIRNHGFDGSGIHCGIQKKETKKSTLQKYNYREYNFSTQPIDSEGHFQLMGVESNNDKIDWNKRLAQFFEIPRSEKYITMCTYYLSLVIGRKNMAALIRRLKKKK